MANLYVEQFNANLKHYQGNFPLALDRVIDFYFHDKLFLSKKVKDALLNLKAYLADIRLPNGDFKKPLGQILVQYDFIKPEKSPKRFSFGGLFKSEKPEFPFWAIKKRPENPLAMYSQKKSRLKKLRQKTKKYVLMPKDFMEVFQCAIQIEKSIRQAEANIAKRAGAFTCAASISRATPKPRTRCCAASCGKPRAGGFRPRISTAPKPGCSAWIIWRASTSKRPPCRAPTIRWTSTTRSSSARREA